MVQISNKPNISGIKDVQKMLNTAQNFLQGKVNFLQV